MYMTLAPTQKWQWSWELRNKGVSPMLVVSLPCGFAGCRTGCRSLTISMNCGDWLESLKRHWQLELTSWSTQRKLLNRKKTLNIFLHNQWMSTYMWENSPRLKEIKKKSEEMRGPDIVTIATNQPRKTSWYLGH